MNSPGIPDVERKCISSLLSRGKEILKEIDQSMSEPEELKNGLDNINRWVEELILTIESIKLPQKFEEAVNSLVKPLGKPLTFSHDMENLKIEIEKASDGVLILNRVLNVENRTETLKNDEGSGSGINQPASALIDGAHKNSENLNSHIDSQNHDLIDSVESNVGKPSTIGEQTSLRIVSMNNCGGSGINQPASAHIGNIHKNSEKPDPCIDSHNHVVTDNVELNVGKSSTIVEHESPRIVSKHNRGGSEINQSVSTHTGGTHKNSENPNLHLNPQGQYQTKSAIMCTSSVPLVEVQTALQTNLEPHSEMIYNNSPVPKIKRNVGFELLESSTNVDDLLCEIVVHQESHIKGSVWSGSLNWKNTSEKVQLAQIVNAKTSEELMTIIGKIDWTQCVTNFERFSANGGNFTTLSVNQLNITVHPRMEESVKVDPTSRINDQRKHMRELFRLSLNELDELTDEDDIVKLLTYHFLFRYYKRQAEPGLSTAYGAYMAQREEEEKESECSNGEHNSMSYIGSEPPPPPVPTIEEVMKGDVLVLCNKTDELLNSSTIPLPPNKETDTRLVMYALVAQMQPDLFSQVVKCFNVLIDLYENHLSVHSLISSSFLNKIMTCCEEYGIDDERKRVVAVFYVLTLQYQGGNIASNSQVHLLNDILPFNPSNKHNNAVRSGGVVDDGSESDESVHVLQPRRKGKIQPIHESPFLPESDSASEQFIKSTISGTSMPDFTGSDHFSQSVSEVEKRATFHEVNPTHTEVYLETEQMVQGNLRLAITDCNFNLRTSKEEILNRLGMTKHEQLMKETVQGIMFLRWNCGSDPSSLFTFDRIDMDQNDELDDRTKKLLHKLLHAIQDHQFYSQVVDQHSLTAEVIPKTVGHVGDHSSSSEQLLKIAKSELISMCNELFQYVSLIIQDRTGYIHHRRKACGELVRVFLDKANYIYHSRRGSDNKQLMDTVRQWEDDCGYFDPGIVLITMDDLWSYWSNSESGRTALTNPVQRKTSAVSGSDLTGITNLSGESWLVSMKNLVVSRVSRAWDKVSDKFQGWHDRDYYQRDSGQWTWNDINTSEEKTCMGGNVGYPCIYGGAVIQYGMDCCSPDCEQGVPVIKSGISKSNQVEVEELAECKDVDTGMLTESQTSELWNKIDAWYNHVRAKNMLEYACVSRDLYYSLLNRKPMATMFTSYQRKVESNEQIHDIVEALKQNFECSSRRRGTDGHLHSSNCVEQLFLECITVYGKTKQEFDQTVIDGIERPTQLSLLRTLCQIDDWMSAAFDALHLVGMFCDNDTNGEMMEKVISNYENTLPKSLDLVNLYFHFVKTQSPIIRVTKLVVWVASSKTSKSRVKSKLLSSHHTDRSAGRGVSSVVIDLNCNSEEDLSSNQGCDSPDEWHSESLINRSPDAGVTNQDIFDSDSDNDISTMLHAPAGATVGKKNRGTAALLGDFPSPSDNQQPGCTSAQLNQFQIAIEPSIGEIRDRADRSKLTFRSDSQSNVQRVLSAKIPIYRRERLESELEKVDKKIDKFGEKSYLVPSIESRFPWFDNTKVHLFNETFPEKVWSLMLITPRLLLKIERATVRGRGCPEHSMKRVQYEVVHHPKHGLRVLVNMVHDALWGFMKTMISPYYRHHSHSLDLLSDKEEKLAEGYDERHKWIFLFSLVVQRIIDVGREATQQSHTAMQKRLTEFSLVKSPDKMMGNNLIDYFNAVFKVLAFEKEEELNRRSKTDSRYRVVQDFRLKLSAFLEYFESKCLATNKLMKMALSEYRKIYDKMLEFETQGLKCTHLVVYEDLYGTRSNKTQLTYAQYVYVMFVNLDLTFVNLGRNKEELRFDELRIKAFGSKSLSELKGRTGRKVHQVEVDNESCDQLDSGREEQIGNELTLNEALDSGQVPVPWSDNLIQVNQIKGNPLFEKPASGETKLNGLWKPELSVAVATLCKLIGISQMWKDGYIHEFPFNGHMKIGPCSVCASLDHDMCEGKFDEDKLNSFSKGFSDMRSKLNNHNYKASAKGVFDPNMPVGKPKVTRGVKGGRGRGGRGRGGDRNRGRGKGRGNNPSPSPNNSTSDGSLPTPKPPVVESHVNAFLNVSSTDHENSVKSVYNTSLREDLNDLADRKFETPKCIPVDNPYDILSDNSYDELVVVEELEPATSEDGDSEEGIDDRLPSALSAGEVNQVAGERMISKRELQEKYNSATCKAAVDEYRSWCSSGKHESDSLYGPPGTPIKAIHIYPDRHTKGCGAGDNAVIGGIVLGDVDSTSDEPLSSDSDDDFELAEVAGVVCASVGEEQKLSVSVFPRETSVVEFESVCLHVSSQVPVGEVVTDALVKIGDADLITEFKSGKLMVSVSIAPRNAVLQRVNPWSTRWHGPVFQRTRHGSIPLGEFVRHSDGVMKNNEVYLYFGTPIGLDGGARTKKTARKTSGSHKIRVVGETVINAPNESDAATDDTETESVNIGVAQEGGDRCIEQQKQKKVVVEKNDLEKLMMDDSSDTDNQSVDSSDTNSIVTSDPPESGEPNKIKVPKTKESDVIRSSCSRIKKRKTEKKPVKKEEPKLANIYWHSNYPGTTMKAEVKCKRCYGEFLGDRDWKHLERDCMSNQLYFTFSEKRRRHSSYNWGSLAEKYSVMKYMVDQRVIPWSRPIIRPTPKCGFVTGRMRSDKYPFKDEETSKEIIIHCRDADENVITLEVRFRISKNMKTTDNKSTSNWLSSVRSNRYDMSGVRNESESYQYGTNYGTNKGTRPHEHGYERIENDYVSRHNSSSFPSSQSWNSDPDGYYPPSNYVAGSKSSDPYTQVKPTVKLKEVASHSETSDTVLVKAEKPKIDTNNVKKNVDELFANAKLMSLSVCDSSVESMQKFVRDSVIGNESNMTTIVGAVSSKKNIDETDLPDQMDTLVTGTAKMHDWLKANRKAGGAQQSITRIDQRSPYSLEPPSKPPNAWEQNKISEIRQAAYAESKDVKNFNIGNRTYTDVSDDVLPKEMNALVALSLKLVPLNAELSELLVKVVYPPSWRSTYKRDTVVDSVTKHPKEAVGRSDLEMYRPLVHEIIIKHCYTANWGSDDRRTEDFILTEVGRRINRMNNIVDKFVSGMTEWETVDAVTMVAVVDHVTLEVITHLKSIVYSLSGVQEFIDTSNKMNISQTLAEGASVVKSYENLPQHKMLFHNFIPSSINDESLEIYLSKCCTNQMEALYSISRLESAITDFLEELLSVSNDDSLPSLYMCDFHQLLMICQMRLKMYDYLARLANDQLHSEMRGNKDNCVLTNQYISFLEKRSSEFKFHVANKLATKWYNSREKDNQSEKRWKSMLGTALAFTLYLVSGEKHETSFTLLPSTKESKLKGLVSFIQSHIEEKCKNGQLIEQLKTVVSQSEEMDLKSSHEALKKKQAEIEELEAKLENVSKEPSKLEQIHNPYQDLFDGAPNRTFKGVYERSSSMEKLFNRGTGEFDEIPVAKIRIVPEREKDETERRIDEVIKLFPGTNMVHEDINYCVRHLVRTYGANKLGAIPCFRCYGPCRLPPDKENAIRSPENFTGSDETDPMHQNCSLEKDGQGDLARLKLFLLQAHKHPAIAAGMWCMVCQDVHAESMKCNRTLKSKSGGEFSKDKIRLVCPHKPWFFNMWIVAVGTTDEVKPHPEGDRSVIGAPHNFPCCQNTVMTHKPGENKHVYPPPGTGSTYLTRENIDPRCYCQTCHSFTHTSDGCEYFALGQEAADNYVDNKIGDEIIQYEGKDITVRKAYQLQFRKWFLGFHRQGKVVKTFAQPAQEKKRKRDSDGKGGKGDGDDYDQGGGGYPDGGSRHNNHRGNWFDGKGYHQKGKGSGRSKGKGNSRRKGKYGGKGYYSRDNTQRLFKLSKVPKGREGLKMHGPEGPKQPGWWKTWMELEPEVVDQVVDLPKVGEMTCDKLITLMVLANFMSSECQPDGLPYDRGGGTKKRSSDFVEYFTRDEGEIWSFCNPDQTASMKSIVNEKVSSAAYNAKCNRAILGFAKYHNRPSHQVFLKEVEETVEGIDGWSRYHLDHDGEQWEKCGSDDDFLTQSMDDLTQGEFVERLTEDPTGENVNLNDWFDQPITAEEPCYGMNEFKGLQQALDNDYDGVTPRLVNSLQAKPVRPGDVNASDYNQVYYENVTRPARNRQKWKRVSHAKRYRRQSNPIAGAEQGLQWPEMVTRTKAHDGTVMVVLDSGAEVTVLKDKELIPDPTDIRMPLTSFNGKQSWCARTGEALGGVMSHRGVKIPITLGYSGVTETIKDNLGSIPVMRKLGYQFWFGDHPFCVTPDGQEVPLYVSDTGYLGLRVHLPSEEGLNVNSVKCDKTKQVGYLSNDVNLWHARMCHQPAATLEKMQRDNLVVGMPKLRSYDKNKKCLSCGLGKSTRAHVGPIRHSDMKKMMKIKGDMDEVKDKVYYPLEQLHLDCCEMDAPDLYGNTHFLVIVDRATSMMWTIPLKEKRELYKLVDKFIKQVVKPYHKLKTNRLLRQLTGDGDDDEQGILFKENQGTEGKRQVINETLEECVSGLRNIRCDRGTEFNNEGMIGMLEQHGAKLDMVPAYVNDGRAEAAIKKLVTFTRCCLIDAGLKKCFWSSIMSMVCHVLNRSYCNSLKGVPYSQMTGLKPIVSYFRQPGSIALCHKQDEHRRKLDNTAFIGITIGYDTADKSWIFLNPRSGRSVRTIHAQFYERSRDPQEMIDMSHLVIDDPKWKGDVKVKTWRCQLWPKVLWPGMPTNCMGNTKDEFPTEGIVPDGFDHDGKNFSNDLQKQVEKLKHLKVSGSTKIDRDNEVERHVYDYCDQGTDSTFPGNIIVHGVNAGSSRSEYITARLQHVVGKRIRDLFDEDNKPKIKVQDKTGKMVDYRYQDLLYDLKTKRLSTIEAPDEEEKPSHKSTGHKKSSRGTKRVQFFGMTVKANDVYERKQFDAWYAPSKEPRRDEGMFDDLVKEDSPVYEWGRIAERSVASFQILGSDNKRHRLREHIKCGDTDVFRKLPKGQKARNSKEHSNYIHRSKLIPMAQNVVEVPSTDELIGYRGNGTFVDRAGKVKPSHLVDRGMAEWRSSYSLACHEAERFVQGIPTNAELEKDETWNHVNQAEVDDMIPLKVPKGVKKALYDKDYLPHWKEAVYTEMNTLTKMGCFDLIRSDHPKVKEYGVLPAHFVFTDKWTADVPPKFSKLKARIVANGNMEPKSEDPFANFSPTAGPSINRFFDGYSILKGYKILSSDVSSAFIASKTKGKLIFLRPPPGTAPPGYVFLCRRFLYGLGRSPAEWISTLTKALRSYGFEPFRDDPCLLRRVDEDGDEILIEAYVDDIKWAGADEKKIRKIINDLHQNHFKMTCDGEVETYLGMNYVFGKDDKGKSTLNVNQTAYVEALVKRFQLEDEYMNTLHVTAKRGRYNTPLPAVHSLSQLQKDMERDINLDVGLIEWSKRYSFPMLVGSVIHAMVHTRPDIAYAVSILSRAMSNAELWHYKAMRHLLLYMKNTKHLGLDYSQSNMLNQHQLVTATIDEDGDIYDAYLSASVDSSFSDCPITYRSTSGYVVWFGGTPVEFECKRQSLVTLSTMESEWVAASRCVCAIRFLHKLMEFVGLRRTGPTKIMEDNAAVIACSTKTVHKARTKHIGTKWMNVREACQSMEEGEEPECKLVQVWTEHQVSDIFTKSLGKNDFERCRETLMGRVPFVEMVEKHRKNDPKVVKMASSYKAPNGVNLVYQSAEVINETGEVSWPYQVVANDVEFGKNYMSLRDCIMGRPAYDIPGYPTVARCA